MSRRSCVWGQVDQVTTIAPGIEFVSTPSHGGFLLDATAKAAMPEPYKAFKPFAGGRSYEEDCDAALIPCAFPALFTPRQVTEARAMVARMADYFGEAIAKAAQS